MYINHNVIMFPQTAPLLSTEAASLTSDKVRPIARYSRAWDQVANLDMYQQQHQPPRISGDHSFVHIRHSISRHVDVILRPGRHLITNPFVLIFIAPVTWQATAETFEILDYVAPQTSMIAATATCACGLDILLTILMPITYNHHQLASPYSPWFSSPFRFGRSSSEK